MVTAALALALSFPLAARTDDKDKATLDVIVNFGDPVTPAGAANQVVVPNDATIRKGGTVIFVVNGGNQRHRDLSRQQEYNPRRNHGAALSPRSSLVDRIN